MNTARAREAAGRHIEVLFGHEDQTLLLELGEDNETDAVAEGCVEAGLSGLDGTVRRAP